MFSRALAARGLGEFRGSDLAGSFLEQDLIDELRFIVTPILLGAGKTVFDAITKRHPLKLLSTKSFRSGNVILSYEPERQAA